MNGLDYYLAGFWLLAAIGVFWAVRVRQRTQPLSARLQFQAVVAGLVAAVMLLISNLHRLVANGETLTTSRLLAILALLLYAGVQAWQLPRLRAAARAEPVKPSRAAPRPFFWQGVLILLPVLILSLICLKAIMRDRAFVEEEARQRARDYVAAVAPQLGRAIATQLSHQDLRRQNLRTELDRYRTTLPGTRESEEWQVNSAQWQRMRTELDADSLAFKPQETGWGRLVFSLKGELREPYPCERVPQPPVWLREMAPAQREAWDVVSNGLSDTNASPEATRALDAFLKSNPGTNAWVNARFLQLRSRLSSAPLAEAVEQWSRFCQRHGDVLSESGLPLGNLAALALLRRVQGGECPNEVWYLLREQINSQPSLLSTTLLEEAEKLVTTNPYLRMPLAGLREAFAAAERDREFAAPLQATGLLRGPVTTNAWLRLRGEAWFCVIDPTYTTTYSVDRTVRRDDLTQVRCYPEAVVRRAFENALRDTRVPMPDYFGFEAQLHGRSFALFNASPSNQVAALSTAGGFLSQPAVLLENSPFNSGSPVEKPFESLPSHPEFTLSVYLADREALFAQHRQRSWWLGAILAAAAGAAVVGFVTARRAYHRQLQLNVMKSNFVSAVSHELRAPIASVRLMAESLERGKIADAQKQQEYFGFIGQECRRLSALIENVLDFARIEQGRKQYEFEPTDVHALVDQTVKLMEPYAAERKVALRVESNLPMNAEQSNALQSSSAGYNSTSPILMGEGRGEGGRVNESDAPISSKAVSPNFELQTLNFELVVDGRALQQALINLLDNAVKHSPDGATVTVRLTLHDDQHPMLTLTVEDSGPGIPQEEHQRIFEQFYRRGSELRRETQGIGIGLSIVKHIVDAHGGRIQVDSTPGHGARFTIELPARPPTVKPEPTQQS